MLSTLEMKEMENYKHSIKMKELKIDTRYKNNQLVIVEARESLIWVQKRVNILSVYMDKNIYFDFGELFKMIRNFLNDIEAKNYKKFLNDYWEEEIQKVEEKGLGIIQRIQLDNELIIEK